MWLQILRVWLALFYLFLSSLFGYGLVLFPAVLFISPLSLKAFYQWVDFSLSLWLRNTIFILENVWGVRLHLYTKNQPSPYSTDSMSSMTSNEEQTSSNTEMIPTSGRKTKCQLIVSNHSSNFDWMYLWVWLAKIGKLRHVRNILKSELKGVPGFGWAMQCAAFVFLKRDWLQDQTTLKKMLHIFRKVTNESTLVLFPEGTTMNDKSRDKSNKFAIQQGFDPYQYCLHPRTTGFNAIVSELVEKDDLRNIIDVTIAFKGPYPVEPSDLIFKGLLPKDIFILYTVHDITLLNSVDLRQDWLQTRWKEKERILKKFAVLERFDKDAVLLPSRSWYRRAKWIGFCIYSLLTVGCIYVLYWSRLFKMYMIVTTLITVLINRFFSGITELILS